MDHLIKIYRTNPIIDILKLIVSRISKPISQYYIDDDLNTLMHIKQGSITMKYLIENRGNPNSININGVTPILVQNSYSTIKYLFSVGANIHHRDNYDFGIFHWQKDHFSTFFLYHEGVDINNYNYVFEPKTEKIDSERNKLLIEGGYDPYNEKYISIPGYFLQRDPQTIHMYLYLRDKYFPEYKNSTDLFHESILFKSFATKGVIRQYTDSMGGEDVNAVNIFNNTPLFIHHDIDIIKELVYLGAKVCHRNNEGITVIEHHRNKNNIEVYSFIVQWYCSSLIQRNWKSWIFKKNYVPFKNHLKKKEFLFEILYLPGHQLFKGGIEYQKALEDFTRLSSQQS